MVADHLPRRDELLAAISHYGIMRFTNRGDGGVDALERVHRLLGQLYAALTTPPSVTNDDARRAMRTYNAVFLANRPEQHGAAMDMKSHDAANLAAFRAVLEEFGKERTVLSERSLSLLSPRSRPNN